MRYTLKDYQEDAVRAVLRNLERGKDAYHRYNALSQFSLAATTGAGKTVMAAAIIEALFFGSDDYDFEPDPGAVVLWFSDDPSLNDQSRARIQAASSELSTRLKTVPSTFAEPSFRPGNVYFLNTQKLRSTARLVRGASDPTQDVVPGTQPRPDQVQTNINDIITNTVNAEGLTLYLIIDEAHRGMGTRPNERQTIVQRLINGGISVPPIPVVFGISATVERFESTMQNAQQRDALPPVTVDASLVQASGLVKDIIALSIPKEKGEFDTTFLTQGMERLKASSAAWEHYAIQQGDVEPVKPLLVLQVGDDPSQEMLASILDTIFAAWPELPNEAVANVFGDHKSLNVGQQKIHYIEPQRVEDSTYIRVLLAKNAISTGWDCPRAEVMVSFRPATDRTHITQLLGRMMRTPLARRIPGNELLNSVACYLPMFNYKTATEVAELLMKGGTSKDQETGADAGGGLGRRVLFNPITLYPNPEIENEIWEHFNSIPSVTIPKKHVKPIRRLTALATALSKDGIVEGAVGTAYNHLHRVLDGRAIQHAQAIEASRQDVLTMRGEQLQAKRDGSIKVLPFAVSADPRAIEDYFRAATRVLSPALSNSYVEHLTRSDSDDDALLDANIVVAAMSRVPELVKGIENEAELLAQDWLAETRVARKRLTDVRQSEYDRLEASSTRPEPATLTVPSVAQSDTKIRRPDGSEEELPTRRMHLLASKEGNVPLDFDSSWEYQVLDKEMAEPGFVGWYRNPNRGVKESLAVAYQTEPDHWQALRPDFIFFSRRDDGQLVVNIIDPHGYHLADALPKLRGLADFAEKFSEDFHRIESVAAIDSNLKVLDLTRPIVREAVRSANSAKSLYGSNVALNY